MFQQHVGIDFRHLAHAGKLDQMWLCPVNAQFFIVHEDSTFLDGQYAAFGYVSEGMDVVDAVCEAAQPVDNNGTILPVSEKIYSQQKQKYLLWKGRQ